MCSFWKLSLQFACLLMIVTQGSIVPDKGYESVFFVFQQQAEGLPAEVSSKEGASFNGDQKFSKTNKFTHTAERNEESQETQDGDPLYVLPANEDPSVPRSDVLSVDPLTLEIWHDDKDSKSAETDNDRSRNENWRFKLKNEQRTRSPFFVLPANKDPNVPRSDILRIDPVTLQVSQVHEIPVSDEWSVDDAEDDSSEEQKFETKVFDKNIYCGDKIYNPRNQTCCKLPNNQAQVWDNPKRLRMGCCGIKAYNTDLEWCCEGSSKVMRAKWVAGEACCGPQGLPFHYLKHKCCPGIAKSYLIPIPRSDVVGNSAAYSCCSTNNSTQPPVIYKDMNQVCCNGVVSPVLGRGTVCCGTKPYNLRTSSCCADKYIYNSTSVVKCCSKKMLYSSDTHVCCNSGAILKPSPNHNGCCNNNPYNPAVLKCCRSWTTGRETLSPKKYLLESCCGGISYNTQESICCQSKVVSKKKKLAAICGTFKDKRETTMA